MDSFLGRLEFDSFFSPFGLEGISLAHAGRPIAR